MKTKAPLILLTIISLGICINACKGKLEEPKQDKNSIESEIEEGDNTKTTEPESERKNSTLKKINSLLRPNEDLEEGKIYTDTVNYIRLDNNYDYRYFLAEKNKEIVDIIYHDELINKLVKDDQIEINWKMTRLEEAGDPEISDVKPFLVSFKKIRSAALVDKKVKVLWRENRYDEELKTEINTIILNKDYLKNIHELEKAALAYVATFIGNECEWDGKVNENRSNLKCKLITHLNLGYQCSAEHVSFLSKWFSEDVTIVEELKKCPTIPNTATIQSTFNEIELVTNNQDQTIVINYSTSKINTREGSVSEYTKTEKFNYNLDDFAMISLVKTNAAANNNSFVVSCGSGCAMTYSEHKIATKTHASELTLKVEMYVNETLSDEYYETYIYTCNGSNDETDIRLQGTKNFSIEMLHPEIQKKLKSYASKICNQ